MPDYLFNCDNQETYDYLKAKATKCKVVLLDNWKEHPLTNPSSFQKRKKDKFTKELYEMFTTWKDERINEEFNDIVNNQILESGQDISKIFVKDTTPPDYSVLHPQDETEPEKEPKTDTEQE